MGSVIKGTGMHLAKRGSDGIIFFAATRTNLLLSYSLTHTDEGMESTVSESVSLSTFKLQTSCSVQRKGKEGHSKLTHQ